MTIFSGSIRLTTEFKTGETTITDQVEELLSDSGVTEGYVLISTGHTTASVHLNNADRDLEDDFHETLSMLVPSREDFHHNKGEYGKNADAHIKSALVGTSVTVPVSKGRLALGQWQAVYFSEFDGPRNRLISIKVFGETASDAE